MHPRAHTLTIGTIREINVLALTDAFREIEHRAPSLGEIKIALALKDKTQAYRAVRSLERREILARTGKRLPRAPAPSIQIVGGRQ